MNCDAVRNRIGDYVDGQLPPAWMSRVEAHLLSCEACSRERDDLRATVRLVSQLGRMSCPTDLSASLLPQLTAAPARGTRLPWMSLSMALRAGIAATAAAGAVAALVIGLVGRAPEAPGPVAPVASNQPAPAVVDLPEWHDANRIQQALGTTDSLVLELPAGNGARSQAPR